MRIKWIVPILMIALLCGCEKTEADVETIVATTETIVSATVPDDGNPNDVTCKGSYTGEGKPDAVVAACASGELTNDQLQVWYWAEVSRYHQENPGTGPVLNQPLDTQICEIDSSVNSWQQYFLKQALSSWHTVQALSQHSIEVPLATEEAYQPNQKNIRKYMTGMPAAEVLYGYYSHYRPNSMHQAYLDEIPQMLENLAREKGYADAAQMAQKAFGTSAASLESFAASYNRSYMYFTTLSYDIEPTEEELDAFYETFDKSGSADGFSVDFRQILLIPEDNAEATVSADGSIICSEEGWADCEADARKLLENWKKNNQGTEAAFAEMANKNSWDTGTAINGGWYQSIRKGQMTPVVDQWCFDPIRQIGDTEILRSDYGVHILYFSGNRSLAREKAEEEFHRQRQEQLLTESKEAYPLEVIYSAVFLQEAEGGVSKSELLYPDIAHERFPEIPLYLQQDYPKTKYGGFEIRTNGCGITSFAMLASYMTDDELTPPEMCALYGRYSHHNGTDGILFNKEPAVWGFYLREKTYDIWVAKKALQEGHVVISIQHPGYWTQGGHYIVCESMDEEGLVRVRDSNIYNYFNIRAHKEDAHKWVNIVTAGSGYWIFEHKVTRIPACSRCGAPEEVTINLLQSDYTCEKCGPAILRRNTYLNN